MKQILQVFLLIFSASFILVQSKRNEDSIPMVYGDQGDIKVRLRANAQLANNDVDERKARKLEDYYADAYYESVDDGYDGDDGDDGDDGEGGDAISYADDDSFAGKVKGKVKQYETIAQEKFWEIYLSPPADWTADQWGFFGAIMTLFAFVFCFLCVVCVVKPCCFGNKQVDPYDSNERYQQDYKRFPSAAANKHKNSEDDDLDTIMRARSRDSMF